jgi:hypothetical protein
MKVYAICWRKADGGPWSPATTAVVDVHTPAVVFYWDRDAAAARLREHLDGLMDTASVYGISAEINRQVVSEALDRSWSVQEYDVPEPPRDARWQTFDDDELVTLWNEITVDDGIRYGVIPPDATWDTPGPDDQLAWQIKLELERRGVPVPDGR